MKRRSCYSRYRTMPGIAAPGWDEDRNTSSGAARERCCEGTATRSTWIASYDPGYDRGDHVLHAGMHLMSALTDHPGRE